MNRAPGRTIRHPSAPPSGRKAKLPPSSSHDTDVAHAIGSEVLFGDNTLRWEGAPTAEEVKRCRLRVIKRLKRVSKKFKAAAELAEHINLCGPRRRCLSGGCSECYFAWQGWIVDQVFKLVRPNHAAGIDIVAVSLAIPGAQVPLNQLTDLNVAKQRRRLRRALAKSNVVEWSVFGLDLSVNDDTQKGGNVYWQLQWYGFVATTDEATLRDVLKSTYKAKPPVPRPVRIAAFDKSRRAISYAFKADAVRRVAYRDDDRKKPCWNTRKIPLKAAEHVEYLLMQDTLNFFGRLLLFKIKSVLSEDDLKLERIGKR